MSVSEFVLRGTFGLRINGFSGSRIAGCDWLARAPASTTKGDVRSVREPEGNIRLRATLGLGDEEIVEELSLQECVERRKGVDGEID